MNDTPLKFSEKPGSQFLKKVELTHKEDVCEVIELVEREARYSGLRSTCEVNRSVSQFISVAQLCPTLCDPMNCSTPGFTVQHQLPEPIHSCPLSQWCHPAISSSVVPFSSCPQSFPASGSFQMSQLFTSGAQSIGVSASTSALLMNTQDWSPLGWTGWISLQSKGL